MELEKTAMILATFYDTALFVRYLNNDGSCGPWMLPRVKKIGRTWKLSVAALFFFAMHLRVKKNRFHFVKKVVVNDKERLYFTIELSAEENDFLLNARPRPYIQTRIIPFSHFDTEGFTEKERALIRALA